MQNNTETIFEMGLLAELAYLRLEEDYWKNKDFNNKEHLIGFFNAKDENDNPINPGIEPHRQDDMIKLLSKYEIVEFHDGGIEGFEGILLKNKSNGEYVISFRGTELTSISDILTDLVAISNINLQYKDAVNFVQKALNTHGINRNNLSLAGHSLGGILTQQVGASLKLKGYAFNPWGADALANYTPISQINYCIRVLKMVGIWDSSAEAWAKDNVLNVSYQDSGMLNGDFLSNLLTGVISEHLGEILPIFGTNVGLVDGHSVIHLNKILEQYQKIVDCFSSVTLLQISLALGIKGYEKGLAEFEKNGNI